MTYSQKFVACVLVNGQVQQELANGTVKIPFGAEYVLRFRNKNNRRAVVKFFIDGENVSGNGYIINANDHADIKRHSTKDCAFKFVELDSPEAVDAGKNGPNPDKEKGLIEAHFYLEKERVYQPQYPIVYEEHHHHYRRPLPPVVRPTWYYKEPTEPWLCGGSSVGGGMNCRDDSIVSSDEASLGASHIRSSLESTESLRSPRLTRSRVSKGVCSMSMESSAPALRDGCTVQGGTTGQSFNSSHIEVEETYTVLKLFLQGYETEVVQANVKRKTNKDGQIEDLEAENERLRKELAELENAKLKEKLEKTKAKAKTPRKRNKTKDKTENG
jgi:hypothetical protein